MCLPIVADSCPPLGNHELAAGREPHRVGKLARIGGLREGIREQFVDIGFAVAARVAKPPDAVPIEDMDLVVANRQAQRLVQA